jgi:PAS domain S-box-containing protein
MTETAAAELDLDEETRLSVLRAMGALDRTGDARFDRIARLTAALFGAPRASIMLVDEDRLWHLSSTGLPRQEYPRAGSLADVMILRGETLISGDIRTDPRFDAVRAQLTQVDVAFYACAPLMAAGGAPIGLLVAGDPEPHPPVTPEQMIALQDLAAMAVNELERDARLLSSERGRRLERQRVDLALEAAGLGEFEWDVARDRLFVSQRLKDISGIGQSSIAAGGGAVSFRFVHPDDRDIVQDGVRQQLEETGRYRVEYRSIRPDDGRVRWMMGAGLMTRQEDGSPGVLIGVVQDISERKRDEEQRETLLAELDHRVKNVLATVQSLAAQSARNSDSPAEFVERFEGRLSALARAHEQLTATRWSGADLGALASAELSGLGEGQASWSGPDIFLSAKAANALSLALHELATNAAKYGALSAPGGRVRLSWRLRPEGGLVIDWLESGGPPVEKPTRKGFGSVLIDRVAGRELGGSGRVTFAPGGVHAQITTSAAAIALRPGADDRTSATDHHDEAATPESPRRRLAPGSGIDGLRVLVVEDSTLLALELESGLMEAGAVVTAVAGDLGEALRLCEEDIDAVVLDVNLNGAMTMPVAERLTRRGVPFVFATGYGERGAPAGFSAPVVRKPYTIQQVLQALAEAVGRSEG